MAVPVVESQEFNVKETASTSHILTKPTGVANGNILVAVIATTSGVSNITAPAGWVELQEAAFGTSKGALYYKNIVDAGTEPATYTFTLNASLRSVGAVFRISGATFTSKSASSGSGSNNVNQIAPSVEVDNTNTLLLTFHITGWGNSNTHSTPAGMVELVDAANTTNDGQSTGLGVYSESVSPGATGTRTSVCSENRQNTTFSLVLSDTAIPTDVYTRQMPVLILFGVASNAQVSQMPVLLLTRQLYRRQIGITD